MEMSLEAPSGSHMVVLFKRPTSRKWEQEAYSHEYSCPSNDQTYDSCEVSEDNHGSYSASKTAACESLQVPKDDGWNASPEQPPLSGCRLGNHMRMPMKLGKPADTQESTPLIVESAQQRLQQPVFPIQFILYSLAFFPNDPFLPHPDDEILSGYEEDVSSIRDGYTAWVKADPRLPFVRHQTGNTFQPMRNRALIPM